MVVVSQLSFFLCKEHKEKSFWESENEHGWGEFAQFLISRVMMVFAAYN